MTSPASDDTQPVMSEANAPIPAVQSGPVAWRYREHDGQDWEYEDHSPQHTAAAVRRMRRGPFPHYDALYLAAPQSEPLPGVREPFTVDDLAQEIRYVDGSNSLGAGALAEALSPFIIERIYQGLVAVSGPPLPGGVGELCTVATLAADVMENLSGADDVTDALSLNITPEPRKVNLLHWREALSAVADDLRARVSDVSGKEQG